MFPLSRGVRIKVYELGERMTKRNKFGLAPSGLALILAIAVVLGLSVSGSAQTSSYVIAASAGSSRDAALPAISDTTDEPILTIKKRVDEVNLIFIANDRHSQFLRT